MTQIFSWQYTSPIKAFRYRQEHAMASGKSVSHCLSGLFSRSILIRLKTPNLHQTSAASNLSCRMNQQIWWDSHLHHSIHQPGRHVTKACNTAFATNSRTAATLAAAFFKGFLALDSRRNSTKSQQRFGKDFNMGDMK